MKKTFVSVAIDGSLLPQERLPWYFKIYVYLFLAREAGKVATLLSVTVPYDVTPPILEYHGLYIVYKGVNSKIFCGRITARFIASGYFSYGHEFSLIYRDEWEIKDSRSHAHNKVNNIYKVHTNSCICYTDGCLHLNVIL